jgi:hypothetical protein
VTAVKLIGRAAAIYEVCAFPARERQPELGGLKKDEGGTLKLVARGNKIFCSRDAEP